MLAPIGGVAFDGFGGNVFGEVGPADAGPVLGATTPAPSLACAGRALGIVTGRGMGRMGSIVVFSSEIKNKNLEPDWLRTLLVEACLQGYGWNREHIVIRSQALWLERSQAV